LGAYAAAAIPTIHDKVRYHPVPAGRKHGRIHLDGCVAECDYPPVFFGDKRENAAIPDALRRELPEDPCRM